MSDFTNTIDSVDNGAELETGTFQGSFSTQTGSETAPYDPFDLSEAEAVESPAELPATATVGDVVEPITRSEAEQFAFDYEANLEVRKAELAASLEKSKAEAEAKALLEEVEAAPVRSEELSEVANKAREQTVACRLKRKWFHVTRKLTRAQLEVVAAQFGARSNLIGGSKKLIDISNEHVKVVNGILSRSYSYWKSVTTPYPDTGIRLLRRDKVEEFSEEMRKFSGLLATAKIDLDIAFEDVVEKARVDLGELFNPADYPSELGSSYAIDYEFPPVEPPNWMKEVHPELYEQQMSIIGRRFEEAIQDTEAAFAKEFADLVEHLSTRLGKDEETGEYHKIQVGNINRVKDFIERFNELNFGGNQSLSDLVGRASALISDVNAGQVRKDSNLRDSLSDSISKLRSDMDGLIVATTREISLEDDE